MCSSSDRPDDRAAPTSRPTLTHRGSRPVPKTRTLFFCRECGNETPRWQGQCPACQAWNTLVEEPGTPRARRGEPPPAASALGAAPVRLDQVRPEELGRWATGLGEFDFVLGGGVVPGSVVLI